MYVFVLTVRLALFNSILPIICVLFVFCWNSGVVALLYYLQYLTQSLICVYYILYIYTHTKFVFFSFRSFRSFRSVRAYVDTYIFSDYSWVHFIFSMLFFFIFLTTWMINSISVHMSQYKINAFALNWAQYRKHVNVSTHNMAVKVCKSDFEWQTNVNIAKMNMTWWIEHGNTGAKETDFKFVYDFVCGKLKISIVVCALKPTNSQNEHLMPFIYAMERLLIAVHK